MRNLKSFLSDANEEYSVDLHLNEMRISKEKVMYITVTKMDERDGVDDYTVVFNGIPYSKQLRDICDYDEEAATLIIKTLKEDALKYAIEYWYFQKDEWEDGLDYALDEYKKEVA